MDFPKYHRQIVEDLMNGKFILPNDKTFEVIKENDLFYVSFFKASFGYDLKLTHEYAFIVSNETMETMSRDISIFFAILCYELDKDGKNFLDLLQFSEFEMEAIESYFNNSAYIDLIQSNKQLRDRDSRRNLLNSMNRRNIIEKTSEEKFTFTPASKVFIEFASGLARGRMNQNGQSVES
jgi:hypothetical protein